MTSSEFKSKILGIQPNLYNFAYMLTSNRDDAYDLVQDTTLKALSNEDKYIENVNFTGWIYTIMRNLFINNYRSTTRHGIVIDKSEDLYQLNLPQDSGLQSPEGTLTNSDIKSALDSFSDEYRIPFSMLIAGYKYQEISDRLHVPVGTIKSRIFYTRKRLQVILADYRNID